MHSSLSYALMVAGALQGRTAQDVHLEVHVGNIARPVAVVSCELPQTLLDAPGLNLVRVDGGVETVVPVQVEPGDPPRLWWTGAFEPNVVQSYRLVPTENPFGRRARAAKVEQRDGRFTFTLGGRRAFDYRYDTVPPPEGLDESYAKSAYLHPLYSPGGRIVSGDFPEAHRHHHGIWFPWRHTRFEGREVDFWNTPEKQGRVEFAEVDGFGSGLVCGWLSVQHRHVDLTAPEGPKTALAETWRVRAFRVLGPSAVSANVIDVVSTQTCASESPLEVLEYHYGGFAFRGSEQWEGARGCSFMTSEGKGRADGNETRAHWVAVTGSVDGELATIAALCNPDNFRAPQPVRLHPEEPYFCFAPQQLGGFEIAPDEPYVSRYRLVVYDGDVDGRWVEDLWRDYASPAVVRVVQR